MRILIVSYKDKYEFFQTDKSLAFLKMPKHGSLFTILQYFCAIFYVESY